MPTIISNNEICESPFHKVEDDENIDLQGEYQLLPLRVYLANAGALSNRQDTGVWLAAGEEVEALEGVLDRLPVVALDFPAFTDGRAYSSANILKRKLGYQGEIRAIGDVRRDQLEQMAQCGFNAFEMAPGQDVENSLPGLSGYTHNYQSTVARPEPLFRQRLA